ncbi:cytochrome P450 [Byssothecium circinans]|uniref:Cytochrome P450 n=1 Tax=Byssothecium circinans TaxID=147558 RepID=A0A6A5TU74_9PLEO|nr:cytochrome P450 [Byssothecium circinans]
MAVTEAAWAVARYVLYALWKRCILVYGYRIFLHPLHSLPGPFAARFTDWYGAYHAIFRRLAWVTYRNHQEYGPVYRHGPNKVVFNSVKALHDIYQNERLFKSRAYLVTQPFPDVYNLFNVLDKRLHRVKRRIIGQGVNERSMREFEPLMMEHVDTFVRELAKSCKDNKANVVDMTERCKYLGLDVIGQLGFGAAFNLQTSTENRFMVAGLETSNFRTNLYIQFPLLKKIGMEVALYPFILTSQMRYYKMLRDLIVARRSEGKHDKKDLYSFVVDIKDPETGEGMRLRDIWSEAAFFMPAGGDTTSTALAAVFFYLSRYPSSYERLATEIRSTFSSSSEIRNGPKLASCVYLRACIDETLRITPPICTTLWRQLPHSDGGPPLLVDGHIIPPGTEVGVNIYTLHHNEAYFPDPFTFSPERWLHSERGSLEAEDEVARKKLMHDAFTPFSVGARGCAGKAMAYQEASLAIAKTLWYLDFERPVHDKKADHVGEGFKGSGKVEFQVSDQFSSVHHGPNLVFYLRGDGWKELFDTTDN